VVVEMTDTYIAELISGLASMLALFFGLREMLRRGV